MAVQLGSGQIYRTVQSAQIKTLNWGYRYNCRYNKDLQVYKMSDELLKLFKLCLHESAVSASNSNINHTQIKTQNQTINSAVDNFSEILVTWPLIWSRVQRIGQKWPKIRSKMARKSKNDMTRHKNYDFDEYWKNVPWLNKAWL